MLYTLFNLKASSVQFRFGFVVSTNVYTYIYIYVYVYFAIVGETLDAYHVE